jgi:glycosyltransferase involved in cell wall biosynthesis
MLPFEEGEKERYGISWMRVKMRLLKLSQSASFRRADGLIFLTRYAQQAVQNKIGALGCPQALIPHGIDERFRLLPRPQRPIGKYSLANPFRFLYVSIIDVYKHQWKVVEAVAQLRKEGFPIELELVGSAYPPALRRLQKAIALTDPQGTFIHYRGALAYKDLPKSYHGADAFIFASSCENMPNILLEAMAAGLPIACSQRGPMPEVLGGAGVYFDPEKPEDIAQVLRVLLLDEKKREQVAFDAYQTALAFTWERCSRETLGFIAKVASASR